MDIIGADILKISEVKIFQAYGKELLLVFMLVFLAMFFAMVFAGRNRPPKNRHFRTIGKEEKKNERDAMDTLELQRYRSILREKGKEQSNLGFGSQSIDDNTQPEDEEDTEYEKNGISGENKSAEETGEKETGSALNGSSGEDTEDPQEDEQEAENCI